MGVNHYELLGVEPGATPEAIRRAWRIAAALHHPDRHTHDGGDDDGFFSDRMASINAAYQTLASADKRRAYDLEQGLTAATCSACGAPGVLRSSGAGAVAAACGSCWDTRRRPGAG